MTDDYTIAWRGAEPAEVREAIERLGGVVTREAFPLDDGSSAIVRLLARREAHVPQRRVVQRGG